MRKLLLAAAVFASATFLVPATQARTLTTSPNYDSAMLIPTYAGAQATVVPVRYMHHRRHHRYHH